MWSGEIFLSNFLIYPPLKYSRVKGGGYRSKLYKILILNVIWVTYSNCCCSCSCNYDLCSVVVVMFVIVVVVYCSGCGYFCSCSCSCSVQVILKLWQICQKTNYQSIQLVDCFATWILHHTIIRIYFFSFNWFLVIRIVSTPHHRWRRQISHLRDLEVMGFEFCG